MTDNPYATPQGQLLDKDAGYADLKLFTTATRIGRLRYLARSLSLTVGVYAAAGIVGAITAAGDSGEAATTGMGLVLGIAWIGAMVCSFIFIAQRLHDLDHSGWLALLMIIPLINLAFGLYLLFAAGSGEANRYGAPPPPNTLGVKLAALIFPLIFVGGIVAAIAIPAYHDYLERARAEQHP